MRYKVMKGSLVLSGLWLSGCFAATAALAETRELTQDMPIQGYARFDIDAGPGALVVTGAAGDVVQARLTLQFPDDWTEAQV